jgi:hypothetical protein
MRWLTPSPPNALYTELREISASRASCSGAISRSSIASRRRSGSNRPEPGSYKRPPLERSGMDIRVVAALFRVGVIVVRARHGGSSGGSTRAAVSGAGMRAETLVARGRLVGTKTPSDFLGGLPADRSKGTTHLVRLHGPLRAASYGLRAPLSYRGLGPHDRSRGLKFLGSVRIPLMSSGGRFAQAAGNLGVEPGSSRCAPGLAWLWSISMDCDIVSPTNGGERRQIGRPVSDGAGAWELRCASAPSPGASS